MTFNERRRLARELHDSTGALIDAIGLVLSSLMNTDDAKVLELVRECNDAIREIGSNIRAIGVDQNI